MARALRPQVRINAVDEYLRREFDIEGFAQMQEELMGEAAQDGLKLKDFTSTLMP